MSTEKTRLEDVAYYLPLYDEDGDLDREAHYHRSELAQGRDFAQALGLTGISDHAAHMISCTFPELKDTASITAGLHEALTALGVAFDQFDPETPAAQDRIDEAIASLRDHITIK